MRRGDKEREKMNDMNCNSFGEKTYEIGDFGSPSQVLACCSIIFFGNGLTHNGQTIVSICFGTKKKKSKLCCIILPESEKMSLENDVNFTI